MAVAQGTKAEAWSALMTPLGLADAKAGDRFGPADGAPAIAGIVEAVGIPDWPELLLCLDRPGPGIAHLVPHDMGGQVMLSARFYLYGPQAQLTADTISAEWQPWLNDRFPPADA
jgi:hypothetical protein